MDQVAILNTVGQGPNPPMGGQQPPGDLIHLTGDSKVVDGRVKDGNGDDHDHQVTDEKVLVGAGHLNDDDEHDKEKLKSTDDLSEDGHIIRSGLDASQHLLSIRDDGDPAITFRSFILGTLMACFQASMHQIYLFKPTQASISGSFIVLILYFIGNGWAKFLPRGDHLEQRFREKNGNQGSLTFWIKLWKFVNPSTFGLKEHSIAAITAYGASNGAAAISVFTVQDLFYDIPLNATTVILSTLSIGLFGMGLTGVFRPITVWHVEAVYWTNIPTVKSLQTLHWDTLKDSKPLRVFWYSFTGMALYEFFPAYIFPWLNSVSIPCLASMKAKGSKAEILTNLFGGSLSNEGLGILNFSFDWQYITSAATSMPLQLQGNYAIGIVVCWIAFLAVYYGDAWGGRNLPFLSTSLRTSEGGKYVSTKVFVNGILDEQKLAEYGLPKVTSTYVWAMIAGNMAIGAVITHTFVFWGKDIWKSIKQSRKGVYEDRHHNAMLKYKEAPWYWYVALLVIAFVLGIVVVVKEKITLSVGSFIVSLVLGTAIAPFSTILYSRFGNGVATNQLMKMVAGLTSPGRPVANLYFSAWSHSVISQSLDLASDLKMGEYLKIPPQALWLTQVYGVILGAFINYVVMISVVNSHRDLLTNSNSGSSAWSPAYFQSQNTAATTWALADKLYGRSGEYFIVPLGLAIGAGAVILHRIFVIFVPRVGRCSTSDLNLPQFFAYAGYLGFNQTQSCVILSILGAGFFTQYYLRNYKPYFFKNYSYLITAAFDGGSLFVLFILSFAVFGAGGPSKPFPQWWGNNAAGNTDLCPSV
ncbi:uncharacterized protein L201_004599 [Kwoniella dendrophila CBS 6074]|uniref:OPT family small oligopeptide transporter n=1 Tax=Kwoniella dendrophila CBS 6074 TaxID=1295534 RepID=A0AAX4JXM5_9TREE